MPAAAPQLHPVMRRALDAYRRGAMWDVLGEFARGMIDPRAAVVWDAPDSKFIVAAALNALGLRAPALDVLATLDNTTRATRDVEMLADAIESLPDTRFCEREQRATLEANLAALAQHGSIDAAAVPALLDRGVALIAHNEASRATDGGIFRRRRTGPDAARPTHWHPLRDERGIARATVDAPAGDTGERVRFPTPTTIEGLDPPWCALWLAELLSRFGAAQSSGYQPGLYILHEDTDTLLSALASTDMRALFRHDFVVAFVGDTAHARFEAHLRERAHLLHVGRCIVVADTKTGLSPARRAPHAEATAPRVLRTFAETQGAMLRATHARATQHYSAMTKQRWALRFAAARRNGGKPLRVLLPTSRYTTFLQHSARDLAAAFDRAGCEARVLVEPDARSLLAANAHWREYEEFKPDLVVMINHPRVLRAGSVPENVPYVCWIQDAMGHFFDPSVGARQGPLDFLVGHLYPELFTKYGYPRGRGMHSPVVADASKFHAGPVAPQLLKKHECEMAFVSHHSASPEALFQQLLRENSSTSATNAMLESLWPVAQKVAAEVTTTLATAAADAAARQAIRDIARREPDEREVNLCVQNFILPIAGRILRHSVLHDAADLAETHGWRLHLYGRGWESHPRFARYAKGVISHDEELRACYQAAGLHLHACVTTALHQRPFECVLSGGVPAIRFVREMINIAEHRANAIVEARAPDQRKASPHDPSVQWDEFPVADHLELTHITRLKQLIGLPTDQVHRKSTSFAGYPPEFRDGTFQALDPCWGFADLNEVSFTSRDGLERLVRLATQSRTWRSSINAMIAARIGQEYTTDALAQKVLRLVGGVLEDSQGAE
jgi:hypothetical protein